MGEAVGFVLVGAAALIALIAVRVVFAWWEGRRTEADDGLKPVIVRMRGTLYPCVATPQEAANHPSIPRLRSPLGDGTDRELRSINVKRVPQESEIPLFPTWDVELLYMTRE